MKLSRLLLIFVAFFACRVNAISISEETQYGSSLFSQAVNLDGDVGGDQEKDVDAPWNWNAEYNLTRTNSTDPSGSSIVDNTTEYTLGGGWTGASGWGLGVSLVFSNTPEEGLSSRGGTMTPSYRWHYQEENKETQNADFKPYFDLKLDIGSVDYLENFSGHVVRSKKIKPISGIAELRQISFGPTVDWKPVAKWKYSLGLIAYFYNRDISQFQSQLDSPQALRQGIAGFSNTTGGLPKIAYNAAVDYKFVEDWKASLTETFSTIAADNSSSSSLKGGCEYSISKSWRVTGSVQWDTSLVQNDVLGILNLAWDSE